MQLAAISVVMRKIIFTFALALGVWAGSQTLQMNSASAQVGTFTPFTNQPVSPLTNQIAFTNTVVEPTNLSALQMSDVVNLLLVLQTNVEQTLPALAFVESNATFVNPSAAGGAGGAVAPITSNPPSLVASQTNAVQLPTSFSLRIGTNTFTLDPATLQAIIVLENDLARTLPVLQSLNGTSPTPTNTISVTRTFLNPAVQSFAPPPLTGSFLLPLTNMSPFIISGSPSAF
jgi:hypothetical protein